MKISKSCERGYCGACKDIKNCEHGCHLRDREQMAKRYAEK